MRNRRNFGLRAAPLILTFCLPLNAQWTNLGPFGGAATLIQADPHTSGTFVAGTGNALLFRSRDKGETWAPLAFPPQLRAALHTLVIDPMIRDVYLAGTSPESPESSGMWRSTDAGATWLPVSAFRGVQVRAIAIYRGSSQVMAAGTDIGIFQSTDGSVTWNRISPADNRELQPVVSLAFDQKDSDTIYAGTPHLPWKTSDGGVTWQSIHAGMMDDSDIFSILVDRNRPQRVFAGACSGIYRSLNGGLTWTKLPVAKGASYRTYTIVQDPLYENVLFAGTTLGMVRSTDGGTTWQRIASHATRSIAFDIFRLRRIFIATDEAGILRSDDNGKTWIEVNRGFSNRRLRPLVIDDDGAVHTSTIYDPAGNGVFRLANGADDWSKIVPESPVPMMGPPSPRLTELLTLPWAPDQRFAADGPGLFFSRDSSRTWQEVQLPGAAAVRSIVALNPPWIAALTASDIYLSSDGATWKACARFQRGEEIHGIVALPGQGLLAATSAGLRISANLGASWRAAGGPLEGNTIQAISRHPVQTSTLFAARYGSIFTSLDAGRSWIRISLEEWPIGSVKQLLVVPGVPDRLFALTRHQGVFVLPLGLRGSGLRPAGQP